MPRTRATSSHPLDAFLRHAAEVFGQHLAEVIGRVQPNGAARSTGNGRRSSKLAGRKLEMGCRYPGCKNRSKGPRFRFMCEQHRKLPKAKQLAVLEKWKAKEPAWDVPPHSA